MENPWCPIELANSDLKHMEDKQKICLDIENPAQMRSIMSSSNNVKLTAKMVPWGKEVMVEYKGVVDVQVVGNCSEGWVEMEEMCLLVVTQRKNWKVNKSRFLKILFWKYYQEAEQFCNNLGGTLASVGSEEKNMKLAEIVSAR